MYHKIDWDDGSWGIIYKFSFYLFLFCNTRDYNAHTFYISSYVWYAVNPTPLAFVAIKTESTATQSPALKIYFIDSFSPSFYISHTVSSFSSSFQLTF